MKNKFFDEKQKKKTKTKMARKYTGPQKPGDTTGNITIVHFI